MMFSIVIPTFNNLEELQACLQALQGLARDDFEVLVGIDGSTDGTEAWLKQASFRYPLFYFTHPGNKNSGRSATRNLTLDHIKGTYTLFLDSDMQAAPDLLDAHLQILESGEVVSIGTVRYRNRQQNLWVRYTSERGVGKYPHGAKVPHQYFITPNTAIPSRYFLECKGFDAAIRHYGGEDMELGYRIEHKFRPQFIHNAQAKVYTIQPKTLAEALPQLREYGGTGLRYITQKWPELMSIYWVNCVHSKRLRHRLFEALTLPFFRSMVWFLLKISPYVVKKILINYLVISYIHEGYRNAGPLPEKKESL